MYIQLAIFYEAFVNSDKINEHLNNICVFRIKSFAHRLLIKSMI